MLITPDRWGGSVFAILYLTKKKEGSYVEVKGEKRL